jgi:hypothetical protein
MTMFPCLFAVSRPASHGAGASGLHGSRELFVRQTKAAFALLVIEQGS